MKSGDNFTDGSHKTRPVLGDVTNFSGKRPFSSISGDLEPKSGDGFVKKVRESAFAKKVCLQVENLVKETSKTKCGVDSNVKNVSSFTDKHCSASSTSNNRENIASIASNERDEVSRKSDLGVKVAHNVVEYGDATSVSMPKDCEGENRVDLDAAECQIVDEDLFVSRACSDKDVGSGRLASGKCGSIEGPRLPESQGGCRSFELERCSRLKADGCVNLNAGADLLEDCSCSFCLKAAYIWTDLHYQDIKGRIAALKKSQKDASFLVHKFGRGKEPDILGPGSSRKSSKLESDLMNQWKSLFLHMENIFASESNQLQASFVSLRDLRENCKMDLERTTGMPSDKH